MLGNEWAGIINSGHTIRNNSVTDCRYGLFFWGGGAGGGNMQNINVYGNPTQTFQKATAAVVQVDAGNDSGTQIHNNTWGKQWSQIVNVQASNVSVYSNTDNFN